ncbi:hypothetical protein [Janibacter alittae]|uniref:Peptide chain release factor 1 n=1 Tax=Janibacter alittae TaxID=3115209 RepID=A0ABZ2MGB1_9MICO
MDLVTRADIDLLAEPEGGDSQVSLFMPTHRFGRGVEADRLAWKNLVDGVEAALVGRLRRPDIEALLAPARRLHADDMAWQYMSDGLAMFLRPGWERTFRVPASLPALATVGDHLVLGPMLRMLSGDEHFLLLALSQRETRLMEGSRNTVEEVRLDEVPTSLAEAVEPQEPRSDAMARPAANAGRGGPAVFYGHGAGDDHHKSVEIERFLRSVSTGLRDVLVGQTSPMVLVGLDQVVATYREVNRYPHLVEDVVERNPDQLAPETLHELAWPLIEQRLRAQRSRVIERFHELHGTGRVSADLQTIAQAAAEGRVETLFVQADPWCWEGVEDTTLPVVQLGADDRYADCELVDAAAIATLNTSGQVYATSQSVVPDSEVAAIFRY